MMIGVVGPWGHLLGCAPLASRAFSAVSPAIYIRGAGLGIVSKPELRFRSSVSLASLSQLAHRASRGPNSVVGERSLAVLTRRHVKLIHGLVYCRRTSGSKPTVMT